MARIYEPHSQWAVTFFLFAHVLLSKKTSCYVPYMCNMNEWIPVSEVRHTIIVSIPKVCLKWSLIQFTAESSLLQALSAEMSECQAEAATPLAGQH